MTSKERETQLKGEKDDAIWFGGFSSFCFFDYWRDFLDKCFNNYLYYIISKEPKEKTGF